MLLLKGGAVTRRYRQMSRGELRRPYTNKRGMWDCQFAHRDLTAYDLHRLGVTTTGANGMVWNPSLGRYTYAAHNLIPNTDMTSGTVAGSPGTVPTGWAVSKDSTLTQTVVGTGVDSATGQTYIDIRFSGTANGTSIRFRRQSGVSVTQGVSLAAQAKVRLVAGSVPANPYDRCVLCGDINNSAPAYIGSANFGSVTLTDGAEKSIQGTASVSLFGAATISFYWYIQTPSSGAYDATFRFWMPQLEYGTQVRTFIPTTNGAVWLPRVNRNPISNEVSGILCEPAQQNLALWSADFSNAAWGSSGVSKTDAIAMIDGGAPKRYTNTTTSGQLGQSIGIFSGSAETMVFIVENDGAASSRFYQYDSTTPANVLGVEINWATEAVSLYAGAGTFGGIKIRAAGPNGGKAMLIWLTATGTAGKSRYPSIHVNPGIASGGIIMHYAGLVTGSVVPLSPIVTQGAALTRTVDTVLIPMPSWLYGRTIGENVIVNGDFSNGTTNWFATSSTIAVVGGALQVTPTVQYGATQQTCTLDTSKCYQCTFDITENTYNSTTFASVREAATTTTYGSLTIPQGATGSFSFVFRPGVAASRFHINGNSASPSGSFKIDNVTIREIDPSVTMLAEIENTIGATNVGCVAIDDTTINNSLHVSISSMGSCGVYSRISGSNVVAMSGTAGEWSSGTHRAVVSIKKGLARGARDGSAFTEDTDCDVPVGTRIVLGSPGGYSAMSGHIKRFCLMAGASFTQAEVSQSAMAGW